MADLETAAKTKSTWVEGAAPGTPSAGQVIVYAKADGLMYSKDDAGAETALGGGSGLADQGTITYLDATEGAAPATPAASISARLRGRRRIGRGGGAGTSIDNGGSGNTGRLASHAPQ